MKTKKGVRKSNKFNVRLLAAFGMLMLLIGGVYFLNGKNSNLNCQYSVGHSYPPEVGFYLTQEELDNWVLGYQGDDPVEHLLWATRILEDSSFPIARETIAMIERNEDKVTFNIQPFEKSGAFAATRPDGDKITINVNWNTIAGPNKWHSYYLLMTIVHESVHVEQLMLKGQLVAEAQGIPLADAYQVVYERLREDKEEWMCGEMEAFAHEIAFYEQIKSSQMMTGSPEYEKLLAGIKSANWDWTKTSWANALREYSSEYDR